MHFESPYKVPTLSITAIGRCRPLASLDLALSGANRDTIPFTSSTARCSLWMFLWGLPSVLNMQSRSVASILTSCMRDGMEKE